MSTYKERYEERKKQRESQKSASSYKDRYMARKIESGELDLESIGKDITDRVNTWFANYNNYVSNHNNRYANRNGTLADSYVTDSSDWLDTISAQKSNFDKEASAIMSYLDQYGDYFGKEYTDSVKNAFQSALGQQSEILKQASSDKDFWSQFADENEYLGYQREYKKQKRYEGYAEKYAGMSYEDILAATNKLMGDEEREWINANKYSLIPEADDFAENSDYRSTYRGGEKFNAWSGTYTDSGFDDIAYDYINRNDTAKKRQGLSDLQSKASFLGLDNSERGEMTDDEIATFNYLYATRSPEEAYEYIDYLTSDLNARQRETEAAKWAKYANESPVGASVLSVIESPLKGLSYVGQIADYASDGKIDQNEGYNKFSYINSAIRNEVTKKVEEKWGGVGSFAYQTGMSMGDFLFNTAVTGGNSALSLALMGSGAAADTVISSKNRGLEDWQAFTLGTAAGAIEAVTEKIGIDALFDSAKLGKGALKYILSNTLAEGAEEGLSNIFNLIADTLVTKDKAEWLRAFNEFKADGMSDFEAFGHAVGDQLILDVLGGAISGGLMGGGGAIVGAIGNTVQGKDYKNTYGADIGSALAGEAVEISPDSKFAQRMQAKAEGGRELSNRQIGKLVQQNETAMYENDAETIKSAAANRLTELGETGDIDVIATALAKQVAGENLKQSERNALKKSTQGQVVAQELDAENIKNGYSGTEWAQKLGTDRINAEAYGRMVAELDTEDSSATGSETEKVQQVTGKLPASEIPKFETGTNVGDKVAQMGEVEASKSGKGDIRSVEVNGDRATFTLLNGEKVGLDKVAFKSENERLVANIAVERVSRVKGFTNEAATAMIKGYDGSISPSQYMTAFDEAYEMGATGTPSSKLTGAINSGISERVAFTAYVLGKNTKNAESILNSESKNGIINTNINESEAGYESGENLHLRNSGERVGSQNTQGQISRVESGAGQAESGGENVRIADSEAARLLNEGREVKVADLGILGGSNEQTVRLVDKANETSSMKEARKNAEARGLKVRFFVGDNLVIKDGGGKWISARAYIKGEHVFIRADHPLYTADQLMRHELGHDMIAKGEVDIAAVRERLQKTVGKENIDEVARLYSDAYAGTGMSAEEIWEECICDSLGDMNIFAGAEAIGEFIDLALPEIKAAASETKAPTQTRGSPEGKASRTPLRGRSIEIETMENNRFDRLREFRDDLPNVWYARTYDYFYVYSNRSFTDYTIIKKIKITDANSQLINAIEGALKDEINGDTKTFNDWLKSFRSGKRSHSGNNANASGGRSAGTVDGMDGGARRSEAGNDPSDSNGNSRITGETESKYSSPEEAKASGKVSDAKFSIEFADDIANKQRKYAADGLSRISSEELEKAIADTAHMVNEMKPYANILPQDKVGKTLVKNGSYDVSVENTTVCIRTLAYNSFVDMVSEKVGRPLTQMESFLVSQKLYEIAKEPQCLYCYVSLDRKAFNEMVIRYTEQRDAAISAYEAAGKPEIPKKFNAEWSLFKEFLAGRKPTTNMWDRYTGWINAYNKGERLVSLSDISTEAKRLELVEGGGEIASQVKDILKYAQSASWAKKQTDYVAYYDEILKLKPAVIRNLNNHYGMRWYSFSDYSGAFIVENMQQITDAAIRGLKGLSYTKDTDFAEIFAPTGMNINISVYAKKTESGYEIDAKQSANIEEAIKLREQYPNVGIVVVATDKAGVEWALAQEWSDVVIPFHTVRTGADVAEFYNWEIFNAEQNDTVSDQNLWDAYTRDVGKKKASKMVYPSEHQNNRETYLSICEQRGLTPRFKSFLENPNYMKLVNETRQSEGQTSPLKAVYNLEAAERSFDKFVEKGGYYEGWYNDGIDVDGEADIVAEDVIAGKKANEVDYGRQDINFEDVAKGRKTNRQHGKASMELEFLDFMEQQTNREVLANAFESVAQNDVEKAKLKDYRENIGKLNAEEEKLMKLRAEIKELSFAKGARDISKIAELRTEAEKTANRIGIYDKRLLTLEASKPLRAVLEREKQKSYNRAKAEARADLDAYRARALVKQEELKTRYQESKKRGVEGRRKTELRHKIKGTMGELNNLLLHGSKNRNVKLGLQEAVAAALGAINMDTVAADERVAKYNDLIAKATDPDIIESLTQTRDRIQKQGDVLGDKLEAMRKAYENIIESKDENNPYPDYYKAEAALIEKRVKSVIDKVGDTPIRYMTLEQLQEVYDLYKMVLTTVRNANTVFMNGKTEDLVQNVNAFMEDLSKIPKLPEERLKMLDKARALEWNEYIPYYAFTRIGSKNFEKFYWAAIDGQDVYGRDTDEAKDFATETREKHHYDKWDLDKVHEFKLADGQVFKVTLKHMMSIYAYSKREQAAEHMRTGGFFFNDKATFRKKKGVLEMIRSSETGYKIDDNSLIAIVKALSEEQRKYVDEMQAYLTQMGEKGNEVTRVLWGIDLFKEKVYFPLKSSTDFVYQANQPVQESSLKNDGMTKETKPGASNPIILEAFDDVWSTHVERMSQYHAYVLPIENLNKILNYGTWANTDAVAVTTMLRARFGSAAVDYFNRFIGDLNGVKGSKGAAIAFLGNMFTKFKKTAVAASFSVIVQQPTAILRAQAVIDPKYFVGQKVSEGKLKETWEEIKKHAPIAIIKEMGGYDAGGGRQAIDWMNADTKRGIDKVSSKVDDLTMTGAAWGDMLGWCTIWNAVKRETISKHHDLVPTSDEFFDIVHQRFNEVIVKTQVYDSTLSRSGYMRSDNELTKMATAFKGEPTLSANILYDSVIQAKRGNITKGTAVRRIGAVYLATVAAALAKSAIYALGDDDEDESYAEKYLQSLGGTLNPLTGDINPLTWLPGISDIISIFDGWDVERTDMAIFKDLKDAIDGLDSDSKTTWRKLEDFAGAVAAFFGQPLKNVMKSLRQIYNGFENLLDGISGGNLGKAFLEGVTGKEAGKSEALYDAIMAGDEARLEVYRGDYKTEDAYNSALSKALRENDERIAAAAEARYNGDIAEYMRIAKEIIGEGNFSQDNVVAAINAKMAALKKAEETGTEEQTEDNKVESIYKVDDFYKAIRGGDIATAYVVREDIIGVAVDNGKSRKAAESAFESSITTFVGDRYKEGLISDSDAKDMLTEFGGKTEDEASSRIRYWAFKAENPEYVNFSESDVNKYYDGYYKKVDGEYKLTAKSAQSYGISLEIYSEYLREKEGLTLKEDIMYIINTLPLTKEQKDALYYLNGWAKSEIHKAPWR